MSIFAAFKSDHPGPPPGRVPYALDQRSCVHERLRFVWRVFEGKNQRRRYGFQCLRCGACGRKVCQEFPEWVGERKCREIIRRDPATAVAHDDKFTRTIERARAEYYYRLFEARRDSKEEWWVWYEKYLQSGAWQAKREEVLERDRRICQACGDHAGQVHHKSYANVGYELLADLISVCAACHDEFHRGQSGAVEK